MQISMPPRKPKAEAIVPMINVVFLLLVFFLMTAQIAPPEPFEVSLPTGEQDTPVDGQVTLYVSGAGLIGYQDLRGDEAIAAALAALQEAAAAGDSAPVDPGAETAEATPTSHPLLLRADAEVEAVVIAGLIGELARAGVGNVTLVTAAP